MLLEAIDNKVKNKMSSYLDLRNCGVIIRERFHRQLVIPIKTGEHDKKYDVVTAECDSEFIARRRYLAALNDRRQKIYQTVETWDPPLGFNNFPEGAKLIFV